MYELSAQGKLNKNLQLDLVIFIQAARVFDFSNISFGFW